MNHVIWKTTAARKIADDIERKISVIVATATMKAPVCSHTIRKTRTAGAKLLIRLGTSSCMRRS